MEGLEIGGRPRLDAGLLSVCVARHDGVRGLLRLALRALLGRLRESRDFDLLAVPEVRVDARRKRIPVAFDGEVVTMEPPLRYWIRPRGLRVIVPTEDAV